ncbi:hypothetical protein [Pseudomonas fluorescens]|uniref:hypothetical protein n=1 Tax=Pseudomonas fluorescens TaxID=294 RepID=UPI0017861F81|nr:hypothetical protein [Pseudomonas fluorescens]
MFDSRRVAAQPNDPAAQGCCSHDYSRGRYLAWFKPARRQPGHGAAAVGLVF